jgi:hypothetical protein
MVDDMDLACLRCKLPAAALAWAIGPLLGGFYVRFLSGAQAWPAARFYAR